MTEYNKNSYLLPDMISVSKFNKKPSRFRLILLGVVVFLIYNYLLFIAFQVIYTYFLYTCFLGLGIGSAILYGLQRNKYTSKKTLFILTLLFSFLASVMFIFIYDLPTEFYSGFREFLSTRPIPLYTIYFFIIILIIIGAIFYRRGEYTNKYLLFTFIILCPFIVYLLLNHAIYLNNIYDWSNIHSKIRELRYKLISIINVFYICFLGLGIRIAIPYNIRQNKYASKKTLFILTFLSSFFVYLVLILAIYISSDRINFTFFDFIFFLRCIVEEIPIYFDSSTALSIIANIQIWIVEFLITFLSAWFFIFVYQRISSPVCLNRLKEDIPFNEISIYKEE